MRGYPSQDDLACGAANGVLELLGGGRPRGMSVAEDVDAAPRSRVGDR